MNASHFSRRQWFGTALGACAGAALAGAARGQDTGSGPAASASSALPPGYTKPAPVTDLNGAPGMQVRQVASHPGGDRTYAIVFAKGDEVLSGLTAFAQKEMSAGYFTAIGAFKHAKLGWFDAEKKAYRDILVNEQVEVVSFIGDIGTVKGKAQVHAHAGVSFPDGSMRGGHVLEATVWPTLEVFCTLLPYSLVKEADEETGLSLYNLKLDL